MSYYKKIPVLDEKEQAEFDKYLEEQYARDWEIAMNVAYARIKPNKQGLRDNDFFWRVCCSTFDKLATPRIYLLQAWLHRRAQEQAGVLSETGETFNSEQQAGKDYLKTQEIGNRILSERAEAEKK